MQVERLARRGEGGRPEGPVVLVVGHGRTDSRPVASDVAVALRLLEVKLVTLARDFNFAALVVKFAVDVGVLIPAGAHFDAQSDSRCGIRD